MKQSVFHGTTNGVLENCSEIIDWLLKELKKKWLTIWYGNSMGKEGAKKYVYNK